jgi:hypothetical protein
MSASAKKGFLSCDFFTFFGGREVNKKEKRSIRIIKISPFSGKCSVQRRKVEVWEPWMG